jgi:hypothetical protein
VAPLRLGGLRGKKSTPSVGWEVPVSWWLSASRSRSSLEQEQQEHPNIVEGVKAQVCNSLVFYLAMYIFAKL